MNKTQLLNVMLHQEMEIERLLGEMKALNSEKNEQAAELSARLVNLEAGSGQSILEARAELEKLASEKDEQAAKFTSQIAQLERLGNGTGQNTEAYAELERLSAEKDELIKKLSAENMQLNSEKEALASEIKKLTADVAGMEEHFKDMTVLEEQAKIKAAKIEADAKAVAAGMIKSAENKLSSFDTLEQGADNAKLVSHLFMKFLSESHEALHEMAERYELAWLQEVNNPAAQSAVTFNPADERLPQHKKVKVYEPIK
ncbi:MAG: hypothetical protein FWH24_06040 [Oscillospiraceae bacterium]|nr:hypothetical protein [Oscillospiraceae bacterium]